MVRLPAVRLCTARQVQKHKCCGARRLVVPNFRNSASLCRSSGTGGVTAHFALPQQPHLSQATQLHPRPTVALCLVRRIRCGNRRATHTLLLRSLICGFPNLPGFALLFALAVHSGFTLPRRTGRNYRLRPQQAASALWRRRLTRQWTALRRRLQGTAGAFPGCAHSSSLHRPGA